MLSTVVFYPVTILQHSLATWGRPECMRAALMHTAWPRGLSTVASWLSRSDSSLFDLLLGVAVAVANLRAY